MAGGGRKKKKKTNEALGRLCAFAPLARARAWVRCALSPLLSCFFPPCFPPPFRFISFSLSFVHTYVIRKIGRQSRLKKHLMQLNAAVKSTSASSLPPRQDEESSSSGEEVLWSDEELDNQSEITIKKLFHGAQNIPSSKRPFRYIGNSKRTQKRRKADARRQAAKNGRTMLDYFSRTQVHNSAMDDEDENDGCASEETASEPDDQSVTDSESDTSENGCISNEELIAILERKAPGTSSKEQWRLEAVLQYLRLLKYEQSTVKASLCIARQLERNAYLARRIRHWARLLQNGQEIPPSMRGKHVKLKSLLDDEDVQHKILQYLRMSKFDFYLSDFVNYVSNNVFPCLGISQNTPIGYEAYFFMHVLQSC